MGSPQSISSTEAIRPPKFGRKQSNKKHPVWCPKLGQLLVNWWFGARWFGILGIPLSNNPFHKGILGIQTTNTNQKSTISWLGKKIKKIKNHRPLWLAWLVCFSREFPQVFGFPHCRSHKMSRHSGTWVIVWNIGGEKNSKTQKTRITPGTWTAGRHKNGGWEVQFRWCSLNQLADFGWFFLLIFQGVISGG